MTCHPVACFGRHTHLLIELVCILEVLALRHRSQGLDDLRRPRPRHGQPQPLHRAQEAGQAHGGGRRGALLPPSRAVGRVQAAVRHRPVGAAVALFESLYLLRVSEAKDSMSSSAFSNG